LKNNIISCLGEWEMTRLEEERDEAENDRFTNTSFFGERGEIAQLGPTLPEPSLIGFSVSNRPRNAPG